MIIVLKPGISKKQETSVIQEIRKRGYRPHVMRGVSRTVIGAIGDELTHQSLETLAMVFPQMVESVTPVQVDHTPPRLERWRMETLTPWKLKSWKFKNWD